MNQKRFTARNVFCCHAYFSNLNPTFVYAQYREIETTQKRLGTTDWKVSLQQQIVDSQNRLNNSRLPEEWRDWLKVRVEQQQYYLDHDINPMAPGAPTLSERLLNKGLRYLFRFS